MFFCRLPAKRSLVLCDSNQIPSSDSMDDSSQSRPVETSYQSKTTIAKTAGGM